MVHGAGAAHIGGALSMADLLAALYHPQHGRLRVDPKNPAKVDRDRFVLSKGHSCVGLYSAIALAGFVMAPYGPWTSDRSSLTPLVRRSPVRRRAQRVLEVGRRSTTT